MKILITPDSFKGTVSATKVAEIISKAAKQVFPDSEIIQIPFSDGGDGSIECFQKAIGGEIITTKVKDPYFHNIDAEYLIKDNLAIIESAEACGISLLSRDILNPLLTTTFGVGELISDALSKGVKKIILTLGGSATNDGGTGMLSALGATFFDSQHISFTPTGGTLGLIDSIDLSCINYKVFNCEIIAMCDVENTICGPLGATYVYGPQKGATEEGLHYLEKGMCHYIDKLMEACNDKSLLDLKGGGAAGGLGIAAYACLNATLEKGTDIMIDVSDLKKKAKNAALIVTGEGKLDRQSFMGKVIDGISNIALENKAHLVVIAGTIGDDITPLVLEQKGVSLAFGTGSSRTSWEDIKAHAEEDLYNTSIKAFQEYKKKYVS
ncbi:MAG TPA: glycerate kinase [Clostridia bacterium]|jgi:glycerate kinase|nr:glycerate kinase [Clostridia bacterium]